jgi:hypothetical protein
VYFPFDLHSTAVFDSHMPCRFHPVPLPCHEYAVLKETSQGYGIVAEWERHGMCELVSAVKRRHVSENAGTGRVVAESWHSRDRVAAGERHGMCELAFNAAGERHGNGMVCVN